MNTIGHAAYLPNTILSSFSRSLHFLPLACSHCSAVTAVYGVASLLSEHFKAIYDGGFSGENLRQTASLPNTAQSYPVLGLVALDRRSIGATAFYWFFSCRTIFKSSVERSPTYSDVHLTSNVVLLCTCQFGCSSEVSCTLWTSGSEVRSLQMNLHY